MHFEISQITLKHSSFICLFAFRCNILPKKSSSQYVDFFRLSLLIRSVHVVFFLKKTQMFLWTRGMQLGQLCRKNFAKLSKIFHSKSDFFILAFFPTKSFHPKCSSGQVECRSNNPAQNLCSNSENFLFGVQTIYKSTRENSSAAKIYSGDADCIFENPVENVFAQSPIVYRSKFEKSNIIYFKIFFP